MPLTHVPRRFPRYVKPRFLEPYGRLPPTEIAGVSSSSSVPALIPSTNVKNIFSSGQLLVCAQASITTKAFLFCFQCVCNYVATCGRWCCWDVCRRVRYHRYQKDRSSLCSRVVAPPVTPWSDGSCFRWVFPLKNTARRPLLLCYVSKRSSARDRRLDDVSLVSTLLAEEGSVKNVPALLVLLLDI